jgi:hypothetical protein
MRDDFNHVMGHGNPLHPWSLINSDAHSNPKVTVRVSLLCSPFYALRIAFVFVECDEGPTAFSSMQRFATIIPTKTY